MAAPPAATAVLAAGFLPRDVCRAAQARRRASQAAGVARCGPTTKTARSTLGRTEKPAAAVAPTGVMPVQENSAASAGLHGRTAECHWALGGPACPPLARRAAGIAPGGQLELWH